MKIVINNLKSEHLETITLENLDNTHETFKKFSYMKEPFEAKIFAINELITSQQLLKFKNNFEKLNICSLSIYSNNRDTVLAGKSLRFDSNFVNFIAIEIKIIKIILLSSIRKYRIMSTTKELINKLLVKLFKLFL